MILQDLFEGRMKDIDIEYQDFLRSRGRNAMTDKQFQDAYGMTRVEWAKKNREWTQQKERRPMAPDAHLFHEETQVNELDKATLASYVKKAAPDRYNRIPNDLMQMKDAEKNRRQWVTRDKGIAQALDKLSKEGVTEENQDDRNARIIAGEIEDAMSQGNEQLVKQKIKELISVGYTLNKQGQLQRMGMYEESQLQEKQDACYHKVKSRYKVWPSAYASGALVQCRKKGAANWGNKSKK
jgi:hypothetical protein